MRRNAKKPKLDNNQTISEPCGKCKLTETNLELKWGTGFMFHVLF
jgi:hypothetical protein